ncbi:TetR/AcrR family transcriptional regulator [Halostreptopolyspora alba]|uniref:TetR/AcrR family transcriptional regulator n=1 Tax=Halostreptopolyspora alba TaxID=2487137 RepID=A0A3N0EEG4_9ACTN|nr:TetR/AcrR family transcriptional regulator [Nocardiopsaceae bacterium YIM 96095]
MPRVSQEHMDNRREQILVAAEHCFARNGFHATSMQDIFAEAELSAGAVYRYFPGKTHIVRAMVWRVLDPVIARFQAVVDAEQSRPLADVLTEVFDERLHSSQLERLRPILLQVWAEMARDEEVRALGMGVMGEVHRLLTQLVRRAQRTGDVHPDADPSVAAQLLMATVQGYIVQYAIVGDAVAANFPQAVTSVVTGLSHHPIDPGEHAWRGFPPGTAPPPEDT